MVNLLPDLEIVEALMKLMTTHKVDSIKFGNIEVTKSQHDMPKENPPISPRGNELEDEDELLFYSAKG